MSAFDYIITLFSLIFALALTHLLASATHMIRHRRTVIFDAAHTLWMFAALLSLIANWISFWDFHTFKELTLGTIVIGLILCGSQYFVCSLVAPHVSEDAPLNLREFHETQGKTYIAAFLTLALLALAGNFFAGSVLDVANWASQNAIVIAMVPVTLIAIFVRARWVQILAPVVVIGAFVVFLIEYYPVLR